MDISLNMEREIRLKAVLLEYDKGTDIYSIAEMFNIQPQTVMTYIRERKATSKQEEIEGASAHKITIRKWSKDLAGREINTPDGKMTVAEVYPHVMRCFIGDTFKTFSNAELYYMNRRT